MELKNPKIVVLDGYTLNPGDNPWDEVESLGSVTVYDRTTDPNEIVPRSKGADIILTNKTPLTKETIDQLPDLKYIGVLATGYNVVDVKHARAKGIPVTNIPVYGTNAVSQFVFALILELCHRTGHHANAVKEGRWSAQSDYSFWDYPTMELYGKTIGIIGFGRIGRRVGDIAAALGMKVIAHDVYQNNAPSYDFEWASSVEDLMKRSDVVSLNCPLVPENTGIINKETLAHMKKSAFLINAARGGLVVDQDLADALNAGQIAGAGIDVVGFVEPPAKDNPLLSAKNCFVTPHIAWAAAEARKRLMHTTAENIKAFLEGKESNVVN